MKKQEEKSVYSTRTLYIIVLFFLFIGIIYSNSLNSSWHFDDHANILDNKNIHLKTLNTGDIVKSFYHWDNQTINRPITNLSFALNWFFAKDTVTPYHLVNILIHFLSSTFLYLTVLKILSAPRLRHNYAGRTQFIAIVSALLWATHPLHVQAITFIVQRATSLSALFSLVSFYTYLLAREGDDLRKSSLYFLLCFLSFLCALGSKENAILIPISLILIEIIFLRQNHAQPRWRNRTVWLVGVPVSAITVFAILFIAFPGGFSLNLLDYSHRTFTLTERILTEPRVLIYYLSQLVFPLGSRLSLEHDVTLSTSLLYPWTTLPAIVSILGTLVFCIFRYKKYPLFSFAVLFFFSNHLIESTILHLEIIFEHRNYLPSFFIFLPFVTTLTSASERYNENFPHLRLITNLVLGFVIVFFGTVTYIRNFAWQTEQSLLLDNIAKAPNQARSYHNLGVFLLEREKNSDAALAFFGMALTRQSPSKHGPKYRSLNEIANIYMNYKKDYQAAIPVLREAMSEAPDTLTPRKNLAVSLIAVGETNEALQHIQLLLKKRPVEYTLQDHEKITRLSLLNLKAIALLKQNDLSPALAVTREAVRLGPEDPWALANLGLALSRLGQFGEAKRYLSQLASLQKAPDLTTSFLLLENSILAEESVAARELAQRLLATFEKNEVFAFLAQFDSPNRLLPVNSRLLRSYLLAQFTDPETTKRVDSHSIEDKNSPKL